MSHYTTARSDLTEQQCRICEGRGKTHYESIKCVECKGTGFRNGQVYSLNITDYDKELNESR